MAMRVFPTTPPKLLPDSSERRTPVTSTTFLSCLLLRSFNRSFLPSSRYVSTGTVSSRRRSPSASTLIASAASTADPRRQPRITSTSPFFGGLARSLCADRETAHSRAESVTRGTRRGIDIGYLGCWGEPKDSTRRATAGAQTLNRRHSP